MFLLVLQLHSELLLEVFGVFFLTPFFQEVYKPQRKYRRQKEAGELLDEESRVHCTLLEYGR